MNAAPHVQLERFLLEPRDELPDAEVLRRADLAAYAYTQAPPHHPAKAALRADFIVATARHASIRAALLPLVRAWREAGIDVLVFKGFYLAEFVYEHQGQRAYTDVDILMNAEQTAQASRLARQLGWLESWHAERAATMFSYRAPGYCGHEAMHLDHPRLGLRLDVHHRILHNKLPWTSLQARYTREAWRASQPTNWHGVTLATLSPADSFIVGLALNRCWSDDDWHLKPFDLPDARALVARYRLSRAHLLARARDLGCRCSLELFLSRCDPFTPSLTLQAPTWRQKQRWSFAIVRERGHPGLERRLAEALLLPGSVGSMLYELPTVLRVLTLLKRHAGDVKTITASLTDPLATPRRLSFWEWHRLKRGVYRDLQLLGVRPNHAYVPLVVALYAALRKRRCPVTLQLDPAGRPWLELEGERLYITAQFQN